MVSGEFQGTRELQDTEVAAESVWRTEHHASCIMLLVGASATQHSWPVFAHPSHRAGVPKQRLADQVGTCSLNPIAIRM